MIILFLVLRVVVIEGIFDGRYHIIPNLISSFVKEFIPQNTQIDFLFDLHIFHLIYSVGTIMDYLLLKYPSKRNTYLSNHSKTKVVSNILLSTLIQRFKNNFFEFLT